VYEYRKSIKNDLPQNIRDRGDCWYGKGCRTQIHKYGHASKLNHICEARR
jgi:E3 ubiquitin-protein ligase CHFR